MNIQNDNIPASARNSRKIYLDFLRIIAIYMVLFNHTGVKGFALYTTANAFPLRFFYLCNAIFITIAVPLFFMISGALLLGKQESIKTVLKKRVLRFLCILLAASVMMYLYLYRTGVYTTFSVGFFFKQLFTQEMCSAYWYLYAYLAYLLMLPFLRRLAVSLTNKEYLWLFGTYAFINLLTITDFLLFKGTASHNSHFSFFINCNYVIYPLMGYYIDQRMDKKQLSGKTALKLLGLSVISIIICAGMTTYKCNLINDWKASNSQTFFETLIFIPAAFVFLTAKLWFSTHDLSERMCTLITFCGSLTFGIYLIERICREAMERIYWILLPYLHSLLSCWIWILCACILGGLVTFIVKKIPFIGNYI